MVTHELDINVFKPNHLSSIKTNIIVNIIKTVDKAATVGSFSVMMYEYISIGNVPRLVTRNKVAVKLLNETTKANIQADIIPGLINGSVIFMKVFILLAPNTLAASSSDKSNRNRLAEITLTVYGSVRMTCKISTFKTALYIRTLLNKISNESPNTTSGTISGKRTAFFSNSLPRNL
jgi:hypothetical protein